MFHKKKKRPTQKRSFLLFELLLSMGLLLICIVPLVQTHVGLARAERKLIEELTEEQSIQERFCAVKIALHKHLYTWEELMQGVEGEGFVLKKLKQSTKHSGESGLLLGVIFPCQNKSYERTVYVNKALHHTH